MWSCFRPALGTGRGPSVIHRLRKIPPASAQHLPLRRRQLQRLRRKPCARLRGELLVEGRRVEWRGHLNDEHVMVALFALVLVAHASSYAVANISIRPIPKTAFVTFDGVNCSRYFLIPTAGVNVNVCALLV